MVSEVPGTGAGGVGDEGVGAHGEAAYGFGVGNVLADEVVEDEAGETAAFGMEGGDAAVDVVVGLPATGEGEVAELEGEGGDEVDEGSAIVGVDLWHSLWLDSRLYRRRSDSPLPGKVCKVFIADTLSLDFRQQSAPKSLESGGVLCKVFILFDLQMNILDFWNFGSALSLFLF